MTTRTTHPYLFTQYKMYHREVLAEPIMNVVGIRMILVNVPRDLYTTSAFVWVNTSLAARTNARSSVSVIDGMKQNYLWLQPFPIPDRQNQIKTEYWEVSHHKSTPIYDFDVEFRSQNGVIGVEGSDSIWTQWLILFDTED